jgi:hypothetical protein
MKFLIFFGIIGLTLTSCSGSEGGEDQETSDIDSSYCNCNELTFDEPYNHFWRFERRKGYTGLCEDFYPDGTKKIEKNFVDGKVDGKMITYHENGQVWEDQEFKTNFQVGEKIIYTKSGEVKFHALYKRGKQIEVLVTKPWLSLDE